MDRFSNLFIKPVTSRTLRLVSFLILMGFFVFAFIELVELIKAIDYLWKAIFLIVALICFGTILILYIIVWITKLRFKSPRLRKNNNSRDRTV